MSTYDHFEYYKKNYKTFTRPNLTANGTMGGSSFACDQQGYYTDPGRPQQAWYCFDGNRTTTGNEWQINSVNTGAYYWISWYNPEPLKLILVQICNSSGEYSVKDYILSGSDDNTLWTELVSGTNNNTTGLGLWIITVPESTKEYKYWKLECKPRSSTSLMILEISLPGAKYWDGTYTKVEGGGTTTWQ